MKKFLLLILILPALFFLGLAFIFQDTVLQNMQWIFAAVVTGAVWCGLVGVFFIINKQAENNPYYTQMVLKKRDEVRLRQKMHAAHKG